MRKIGEVWFNTDDSTFWTRISRAEFVSCEFCLFYNTGPCNVGQFCCRESTIKEIVDYIRSGVQE